jgi:hypothetical protein
VRGILEHLEPIVPPEELQDSLQKVLSEFFSEPVTIHHWHRRVSDYSSSYLLEELDVDVSGHGELKLMFKDLSRRALLIDASRNKPAFCDDSLREIEIYRKVLQRQSLGTATFFGAVVDENAGRFWLFLERLAPVHLWQMGEFAVWNQVAAWLARTHLTLTNPSGWGGKVSTCLLQHNEAFYNRWMQRAQEFVRQRDKSADRTATRAIDGVAQNYGWVVQRLLKLPRTIIHGEFYPSNVLLENPETDALRVCAIDWEMAAYGPGLIDLAALSSGSWTAEERETMAWNYYSALTDDVRDKWAFETFQTDLQCCRLHQAIQFLGWSRDWTAPPEHVQDWLDEAVTITDQLPF